MSDDLKARLRAAIDDCGWDGIDETVVEEAIARIATLETRVEVEVELRKASYERIAKLEAENARLWSALVKACDDAWTEDPHMARRYHEEANP